MVWRGDLFLREVYAACSLRMRGEQTDANSIINSENIRQDFKKFIYNDLGGGLKIDSLLYVKHFQGVSRLL